MATDLEVGIRHRVLGMKVDQPGAVILPTSGSGRSSAPAPIKSWSSRPTATSSSSAACTPSSSCRAEDPSLYPEVPDFAATSYHVVAAADLRKLIRRTIFATDVESTRYALGGVLVELTAETDHDGRYRRPPPGQDGGGGRGRERRRSPAGSPVIPVKALKLIERNLDDDDPPVHLAIQAGAAVLVRTERAVIYSRLVEGRFPRYQDVFPANVEVKIPLEAGPLRLRSSRPRS